MSSTNPQPLTGIPRPKVAPPPLTGASSSSTGRRPIGNPRNGLQPQLHPTPTAPPLHAANRANDLSSIMSDLSLARPRPLSSSQLPHASTARKLAATKPATVSTVSNSADDDDDDDIQILPTSTPTRPRPSSSSYHSAAETKAALRALTSLVAAFTGPLSLAQVDAIQAILYPPTRPTESLAKSSASDDVLSDLAHITAFPGTRLARAAEAGDGHADEYDEYEYEPVVGGDPTLARPGKPPGDLIVKDAPGRSVAHRALAMKLAEHRRRKDDERNGADARGSAPGTPAGKSETPLRSSRFAAVPGTPALVPGHGSGPGTDTKPTKREPVDTLDRVLLEVSAKTRAATGGPSKVLGLGTATRLGGAGLGGAQPQGTGKRRLVKPVQPPTL